MIWPKLGNARLVCAPQYQTDPDAGMSMPYLQRWLQKKCQCRTNIIFSILVFRHLLKGTVSRDFFFWFFSWISFPQAPENTIRPVSNFFENSRRYSQLKIDHRYQQHRWQICHPCQRHRRQFCRRYQRHRRQILPPVSVVLLIPVANLPPVSTILAANLPPVSTTPVANCHWYQRHQRQICPGVSDTGGKQWD